MKAIIGIKKLPAPEVFRVWVFSENLRLAAELFQGELSWRDMVAVYANLILLMDVLFGVAFIIVCLSS